MYKLKCKFSSHCGACSQWDITYEQELKNKETSIKAFLQDQDLPACEIKVLKSAVTQLRDRADLQWRKEIGWGFYNKDHSQITRISECILFSMELQKLYDWFSSLVLPVPVASARLRVSPDGNWGVWLDLANLHVKALLEEKTYLLALLNRAFVEIGQRRKKLKQTLASGDTNANANATQLRLVDPEYYPWFQTYSQDNKPMPLYCAVGSFTQVGFHSNQILVRTILDYLVQSSAREVLELGAGIGNFTLPLLSAGFSVLAVENDKQALAAFAANLKANFENYSSRINLQQIDFNRLDTEFMRTQLRNPKETSLLVDPPRSGLGRFLSDDFWHSRPFSNIIYVSCSLNSWAADSRILLSYGYKLQSITLVDQFPRTDHLELVSNWQ
jgi:23S rRNA (uracil1939-C5)-methyltransferase